VKIYLAGKITKNGWRESLVKELRDSFDWEDDMTQIARWPVLFNGIAPDVHYTGPYFIRCDHGCYHGDNQHGVGLKNGGCSENYNLRQRHIIRLCKRAILDSDFVFAWIDSPDCYGTIAEIGIAHAAGVRIHIAGPARFDELWFLYGLTDFTPDFSRKSAKEAMDAFLAIEPQRPPWE
jgi:hypothetical protein